MYHHNLHHSYFYSTPFVLSEYSHPTSSQVQFTRKTFRNQSSKQQTSRSKTETSDISKYGTQTANNKPTNPKPLPLLQNTHPHYIPITIPNLQTVKGLTHHAFRVSKIETRMSVPCNSNEYAKSSLYIIPINRLRSIKSHSKSFHSLLLVPCPQLTIPITDNGQSLES